VEKYFRKEIFGSNGSPLRGGQRVLQSSKAAGFLAWQDHREHPNFCSPSVFPTSPLRLRPALPRELSRSAREGAASQTSGCLRARTLAIPLRRERFLALS